MDENLTPRADWVVESLMDDETEVLQIDGHDSAIIGYTNCITNQYAPVLVYSRDKIIDNLVKDGMDYEEAVEFFEFNIAGAYMGEGTPLIIVTVPDDLPETEET